jgi:hypothetical protein
MSVLAWRCISIETSFGRGYKTFHKFSVLFASSLSFCDICVKQKILVINEMKRDRILLKPKVKDQDKLR